MAKKSSKPEFLDDLELPKIPTASGKKPKLDNALASVTKSQVATAAKKQTDAKGRITKTLRLPPDLIADIDNETNAKGYGKMDFWHWLVASAWEDYLDGKRPSAKPVEKREIDI